MSSELRRLAAAIGGDNGGDDGGVNATMAALTAATTASGGRDCEQRRSFSSYVELQYVIKHLARAL